MRKIWGKYTGKKEKKIYIYIYIYVKIEQEPTTKRERI